MQGYRAASYGDGFADVYDEWYPSDEASEAIVAALVALAGPGPVLELGAGTGRLCLPLAQRGLAVVGLDASPAMLARLAEKSGATGAMGTAAMVAVLGDMADFDVSAHGPFRLVFCAFNTLFNLASRQAQAACFRRVAAHLDPGEGRFALECFVPGDPPPDIHDAIEVRTLATDRVVLRISRQDPATQTVSGQHVELTEAGGVRLRPWHLRYAGPAELDELATAAGLCVESRWSDWSGSPFAEDCTQHVTIYRRAPAAGLASPPSPGRMGT